MLLYLGLEPCTLKEVCTVLMGVKASNSLGLPDNQAIRIWSKAVIKAYKDSSK